MNIFKKNNDYLLELIKAYVEIVKDTGEAFDTDRENIKYRIMLIEQQKILYMLFSIYTDDYEEIDTMIKSLVGKNWNNLYESD